MKNKWKMEKKKKERHEKKHILQMVLSNHRLTVFFFEWFLSSLFLLQQSRFFLDKWGSSMSLSQFTAEGDVKFEAVLFVPPKASRGLEGIAGRELLKLSVQFMGLTS
ncbi:hypothetical protein MKW92_028270 [Papaver armeniacum]|nr:hypothetical protein MKW92_028270 [Papaver armeniacum]